MKYKVCYSGFAYIEADSMQEAEEMFEYDDFTYKEQNVDRIEEVDSFIVSIG